MDILDLFVKAEKCTGTKKAPVGSPKQRSFCKRMCKYKKTNTGTKKKKDPDSCINKALRRWKCRCAENKTETIKIVSEYLIDGLFSRAKENLDERTCDLLSKYVAFLRALYLLHQQHHWMARGYEQHLLFQRLYENVQESADEAAERVVGLCGELKHTGLEARIAEEFETKEKTILNVLASSLNAEKSLIILAKSIYDELKAKDSLTLGLDDLIMSQSSECETRIYLLQQAMKAFTGNELACKVP